MKNRKMQLQTINQNFLPVGLVYLTYIRLCLYIVIVIVKIDHSCMKNTACIFGSKFLCLLAFLIVLSNFPTYNWYPSDPTSALKVSYFFR